MNNPEIRKNIYPTPHVPSVFLNEENKILAKDLESSSKEDGKITAMKLEISQFTEPYSQLFLNAVNSKEAASKKKLFPRKRDKKGSISWTLSQDIEGLSIGNRIFINFQREKNGNTPIDADVRYDSVLNVPFSTYFPVKEAAPNLHLDFKKDEVDSIRLTAQHANLDVVKKILASQQAQKHNVQNNVFRDLFEEFSTLGEKLLPLEKPYEIIQTKIKANFSNVPNLSLSYEAYFRNKDNLTDLHTSHVLNFIYAPEKDVFQLSEANQKLLKEKDIAFRNISKGEYLSMTAGMLRMIPTY